MTNKEYILAHCNPESEVSFSLEEYRDRLMRLRKAVSEAGLDVVFLSSPESINYISGFKAEWYQGHSPVDWHPASGIAVSVDYDDYIHFDTEWERVLSNFTSVTTDLRTIETNGSVGLREFIVSELKKEGWLDGKRIGLEMWSYRPNRGYSESFQALLEAEGAEVVDATSVARGVRRLKSPQEINHIKTAQRIAEIGMAAAADTLRPGATELEVWGELMSAMAKAGGENPGITLPVCSGQKSACVHGLASRRKIMPGDIVNVDVCGVYNRYHANMARPFSMGEPDPAVAQQIEKVAGAVEVVAQTIRPNLPIRDLLKTMEDYYKDAGIWDDQWWIGGYELGIAFPPDWVGEFYYDIASDPGDAVFEPGTVVNYEANFYLPAGAGLAMMINTLAFYEDRAEMLHRYPTDLEIIS